MKKTEWKMYLHDPVLGILAYEYRDSYTHWITVHYTYEPYFRPEVIKIRYIELIIGSEADKFEIAEPIYCSSLKEVQKWLKLNNLPLIDKDKVWADILSGRYVFKHA